MESEVRILEKLISINSSNPPGATEKIAKFIASFLKKNVDAKVLLQKVSAKQFNVVVKFGKPKILLNAHLDTVPASQNWQGNPLKAKKSKGKIFGLGAADVKGSIACILAALSEQQPKNLMILFSSDEEHGFNSGMKTFLKSNFRKGIKYAIVSEPSKLSIVSVHKGTLSVELTIFGKSAHAAYPEKGANPIETASDFIQEIKKLNKKFSKKSFKGLKTTFAVTVINAGFKTNVIPSECKLRINVRFAPNKTKREILKEIEKTVKKLKCKYKLKETFSGESLHVEQNSKIIKLLKACGIKKISSANYWSEAALLQGKKIESIIFAPGNPARAHTTNEFVSISELKKAKGTYQKLFGML